MDYTVYGILHEEIGCKCQMCFFFLSLSLKAGGNKLQVRLFSLLYTKLKGGFF